MHHSDSHSRKHVFPLCVLPLFSGARELRLHGGGPGPAESGALTLTFQHARLHRAADVRAADALAMPRCTGSPGLGGPREGRCLSRWQGVTNNCSSADMLDGPTANLPDGCVALRQECCFSRRSQREETCRNQHKQTEFNVLWPLHKLPQIDLLFPFTFCPLVSFSFLLENK